MAAMKLAMRFAASILLPVAFCAISHGRIIYVDDDASGANDGTSWSDAYAFLQDALADANSAEKPAEIRVAQGIYKPDSSSASPDGTSNRKATFRLINNVTIKGGHAGLGEPDPNMRDVEVYVTVLNGDLNRNDIDLNDPGDLYIVPDRNDNSENVVTGSNTNATAVLNGVTISGGYISYILFGGLPAGGAGMIVSSGSPTLIDCTFTDNVTSGFGAGVFIYENGEPKLINCKFSRNFAWSGGGIFGSKSSNPTLTNCMFSDNYAQYNGGGMYIVDGNPKLTNCTFSLNVAFSSSIGSTTEGGGMYNRDSSPVLTNCTFSENSAAMGGAMYNEDCNTMLIKCEFMSNMASSKNGAVSNYGGQLIAKACVFKQNYPRAVEDGLENGTIFTNCTFSGNSSPYSYGGAAYVFDVTFNNCLFAGNRALGDYSTGGAVYSWGTATFNNCTFSHNWANSRRAIDSEGTAYVNNCIFWGSEEELLADGPLQFALVDYSNVQGGWMWPGEGNIDADPLFAHPGHWADVGDPNVVVEPNDPNAVWVDGDYHLKSQAGIWDPKSQGWVKDDVTSPCIDAGDPNSPIGHEPFPNGGVVNMGAYGGTAEASKSYFGSPVCETIIAGDINGDCKVDFKDLMILIAHWHEDNSP